ncbi:hypothetical protein SERLA73DRAFT_143600 [Serpula lacrymans var. lacrymans S7.3]|uniref:Uncharacterized protein n=1 Tax=Serpula lacrymans var. lacrymans (strain S7.3) TaxID=936435 RepID=F8QAF0_SERL3|nr:hypothetical protein SERLA73DRAFT_143600 [Serpula lacrymans var. lacrymans S7.3]
MKRSNVKGVRRSELAARLPAKHKKKRSKRKKKSVASVLLKKGKEKRNGSVSGKSARKR